MKYCLIDLEIHHDNNVTNTRICTCESVPYYLGRDAKDLRLNYKNISRQHCYMLLKHNKITLIDNESTNGTYVNSIKIDHIHLQTTDLIQIGPLHIRVNRMELTDKKEALSDRNSFSQKSSQTWMAETRLLTIKDLKQASSVFIQSPLRFLDETEFNLPLWQSLFILMAVALFETWGEVIFNNISLIHAFGKLQLALAPTVLFAGIISLTNKKTNPLKFGHVCSLFAYTKILSCPLIFMATDTGFKNALLAIQFIFVIIGLCRVFLLELKKIAILALFPFLVFFLMRNSVKIDSPNLSDKKDEQNNSRRYHQKKDVQSIQQQLNQADH